MNITKSKKQNSNKKKPRKQLSIEERFQRQWQRVQDLQKSNAKLRQKVTDFSQTVSRQIEKDERLFCFAKIEQTKRLIQFIPKKTLPEYQREELIFWVQSNIEEVLHNPFSKHSEITHLTEQFSNNLDVHEKNQFEKWQKKYDHYNEDDDLDSPGKESEESVAADTNTPGKQEPEDSSMFEGKNSDNEDGFDEFSQEFFEEGFSNFDKFTEKQREESNALSKLLKSTSISKLFRRVAKSLHPDLEQDEVAKKEKHKLMTELVEARENKDIVKIIAMYTEHVGEVPPELFNGDYEKMITLLKYQVERLEQEKMDILEENPTEAAIYLRFHDASNIKVKNKIRKHLEELEDQTHSIKNITDELTSLKKIKPILQTRNRLWVVMQ